MEEEEEEKSNSNSNSKRGRGGPLNLDWDKLLPIHDSQSPPPMDIVSPPEDFTHLSDHHLLESYHRKLRTFDSTANNLPDKGHKLKLTINHLKHEIQRRKSLKEVDESEESQKATTSTSIDVPDGSRQENSPSQAQSESSFASIFCKKIEENDCRTTNPLKKTLSLNKHCDNQKVRENGEFLCKRRKRDQCASNLSQHDTTKIDKRKNASQFIRSDDSRSSKGQAIVLDDEDETSILEKECQENKLDECLKEAKIYYPSSDDPKCVEICYGDLDCLAPEGYLTSTIMNFYIRYLQQQASLTERSISDYHFFNTYFYKKLNEAVSYKRSDRDTLFAKFRRWWKGTNIFQKAYILIPIHEDLHWSLIIISFPEKKDESGPIILHLDSLSLHSSRSVFGNIKSFLREEWKYVDKECVPSDIPIADKIWKHLPRRIEDKILAVPQQKNEHDCGLFVLYFIERFIEEAPERLKKKDLNMFGKKWFTPEEASSLRVKIHNLLKEEFQKSCKSMSSAECVNVDNNS